MVATHSNFKTNNKAPGKNLRGNPLSNAELCFLVAMASWAMLFGTLILTFVLARVKTPIWPPPYIESFPLLVPFFSTVVIGLSSFFITKALKAYSKQNVFDFKFYWLMGIGTGVVFGTLQFFALKNWMTFDVRSHVYSSSVAFMVIFHGLHFIFGLSGLAWKYIATLRDTKNSNAQFDISKIQSLRLWSWFWHFLGVVWLAIFIAVAV